MSNGTVFFHLNESHNGSQTRFGERNTSSVVKAKPGRKTRAPLKEADPVSPQLFGGQTAMLKMRPQATVLSELFRKIITDS